MLAVFITSKSQEVILRTEDSSLSLTAQLIHRDSRFVISVSGRFVGEEVGWLWFGTEGSLKSSRIKGLLGDSGSFGEGLGVWASGL